MTAGFKTEAERNIFWTMLNYAQQFFDSDTNQDFAMFDSILNHKDLIFQDATVRLVQIDSGDQDYKAYLGDDFIRSMERHKSVDCVTGAAPNTRANHSLTLLFSSLSCFVIFLVRLLRDEL